MKTVILSLVLTLGLHSSLGMSATETPETELNLEEVAADESSEPAQTIEPEETAPSTSFWKRKSTWVAAAVVALASYSLYSYKYKTAPVEDPKNKKKPAPAPLPVEPVEQDADDDDEEVPAKLTWGQWWQKPWFRK